MKTVVFVGPSLAGETLESTDALTFLPPAQQGDVIGAAFDGAERIVLIDGYFGQHLSVWHKEILEALRRGVDVVGAASMGALRAIECEAYGMRGIGRVFAMFKRGLITNDDEVAMAHAGAEHGWRNLSLPLVNVRMTMARAMKEGRISREGAEVVIENAAEIFYAARHDFRTFCGEQRAAEFREIYVDVKRVDALEAIELARGEDSRPDTMPNVPAIVRHGGLLDEDRVVTVEGERVRVRNLGYPALLDEVGFLRAASLRFAAELGIARPSHDDEGEQQAADELALEQLRTWLASTAFRSDASRQRIFAAAKSKRAA